MGNKPNNGDTVRATMSDGTIVEGTVSCSSGWGFWIGGIVYHSYSYSCSSYEITKRALPPEPSKGSVVGFGNATAQRFLGGWYVIGYDSQQTWEDLIRIYSGGNFTIQPVVLREGWAV